MQGTAEVGVLHSSAAEAPAPPVAAVEALPEQAAAPPPPPSPAVEIETAAPVPAVDAIEVASPPPPPPPPAAEVPTAEAVDAQEASGTMQVRNGPVNEASFASCLIKPAWVESLKTEQRQIVRK